MLTEDDRSRAVALFTVFVDLDAPTDDGDGTIDGSKDSITEE